LFVTKVERFKEAAFVAETITTYKSRMRRHGIHAQPSYNKKYSKTTSWAPRRDVVFFPQKFQPQAFELLHGRSTCLQQRVYFEY